MQNYLLHSLLAGCVIMIMNSTFASERVEVLQRLDVEPRAAMPLLLARADEGKRGKVRASKASAKSIAEGSSRGARAVSISLSGGSRPYYKVRLILPNGKVKNVKVDAMSGSLR